MATSLQQTDRGHRHADRHGPRGARAGPVPARRRHPARGVPAIAAASFLIPIALWCFFTYSGRANALILPTPTRMFQAAWRDVQDGDLLPDIKISVYRIAMGFVLSAVLAIPIGILMGAYKTAEAAHEPFVGFIRYVPVPALIPLVMVRRGH